MAKPLGLTNKYLNELCKTLTGSYFVGTFPCDYFMSNSQKMLIKILNNKAWPAIINLSPSSHDGTHFVCVTYNNIDQSLLQTWAAQFRLSKNERLSYVTHLREV